MRRRFLQQYNLGEWLGAAITQASNAQFYNGLIQYGLVAVAATAQIQKWFPWVTFPMLLATLLLLFVLIMILDFKFVTPARWTFTNRQAWKHESPIKDDTNAIKARLDIMQTQLNRIEEKLKQ